MSEPVYLQIARDLDNQVQRLEAQVAAQKTALAHWRREADRDAGTIARLKAALWRVVTDADTLDRAADIALEAVKE